MNLKLRSNQKTNFSLGLFRKILMKKPSKYQENSIIESFTNDNSNFSYQFFEI
mgnify:CR=1 FL=1